MTANELIRRIYDNLDVHGKGYFISSTATGGSTSTIVDTAVSPDSTIFENYGYEVEMTSGNASGQRRKVTTFSSNTFTVDSNFSHAVAASDTYIAGPGEFWSFARLLKWITDEANNLKQALIDPVFFKNIARQTTTGIALSGKIYGHSPLPSDFIRPLSVFIGDSPARIVRPNERRMFYRDSYMGNAVLITDALQNTSGKPVLYRPKDNATLTWNYIKLTSVSVDESTVGDIPEEVQTILIDRVTARAFKLLPEGQAAAQAFQAQADEQIVLHNEQAARAYV